MKNKLVSYLKKYIKYVLIIFILSIIVMICDLKLPEYMANIIDIGIKNKDVTYIINVGVYMIIFTIIGVVTNIIIGYFSSKLSNSVSKDMRIDLYNKLLNLEENIIKKFDNSSLINRLTNDVNQVNQSLFMILRIILMAPIIAIGVSVKVFTTNKIMSTVLIISIILMFIIIILLFKKVFPKINYLQKLLDKINLLSRENISGIKTIKSFNKERYHINKFDNINKETLYNNIYINKITLLLTPLITLIINILTLLIMFIGTKEIMNNNLEVGVLISYIEYMIQMLTAFLMISILFIIIPKLSVSYKRINEILNCENTIINSGKNKLKNIDIEFKDVYFAYNDEYTLKNISFKINSGEKVGIIGSFASGKSTLINLITRMYEVNKGNILIGGKDIRKYDIHNLRKNISVCMQENTIYKGNLKSNLLYTNKVSSTKLKKILNISKVSSFIKTNNIFIAEDGKNLSGGQARRLVVARTLLKDAKIYIFDDPTNSIDYKNSNYIIKNVLKYLKNKTVIVVTQRIANIKNFDKIIVLDKGCIDNIGTHEQLLKTSNIYKELYDSQKVEEL